MADDPLKKLVERGRDLAAAERARKEQSGLSAATDAARERELQIRNSVSAFARWIWVALGALLGLVTVTIELVVLAALDIRYDTEWAGALIAFSFLVPGLVLMPLRPWVAGRAVAREEARARGLPFRFVGYPEALGSSTTEGTAVLTIRFVPEDEETFTAVPDASFRTPATRSARATSVPDDDIVASLFRNVGGTLGDRGADSERCKRIRYQANFGDTSVSTNAHLAAWVRRAVPLLVLLHAEHPIEEVQLTGFER